MTRGRLAAVAATLALLWAIGGATPIVAAAEPADSHHAATAGAAHAEHEHVPSLRDLLFPAINFAVYLVIVVRFVIPAMRDYLRQRRSDAVETASQASEALSQAERVVAANRQRLGVVGTEADQITQDLVAIATRHGERLVTEAEESGTRRLADARLMAEQERRRAIEGIRSEIATAAVGMAEQKIRTVLTPADQRSFVEQFLKDAAAR